MSRVLTRPGATTVSYAAADLDTLEAIEEDHFWFRARRRIIIDAIARWFPDARRYLEIGCGTGYNLSGIANAFPTMRIVASDALARGLASERLDGLDRVRCDAQRLPFAGEFDLVGAFDVLEHIGDDSSALEEMRRACRTGGGLLLTVPQHAWLWSPADAAAQHCRRYSRSRLRNLMSGTGFEILGCTSFNTINLPLHFARNLVLRATGRGPAARRPAAALNTLLEAGMDLDRLLIRAGMVLPAGGSLLVAARREGR